MKRAKWYTRLMKRVFKLAKKLKFPNRSFSHPDLQKILIISNTGLGDTMWGTPALKMLRERYPKSHITVLTSPLSEAVLKHNPHINQTVLIKNRGGLPYILRFIPFYRQTFDTIIIFHSSYRWVVPFCYFLAPKRLIGFKHDAKEFGVLFTKLLDAKLNHPIIQRLMLVKEIGVEKENYQMSIYLQESEELAAEAFLNKHSLKNDRLLIGLQPGASELFKRWPLDHFKMFAKRLHEELGAQIIVFGDKEEQALAKEIAKFAPITMAAGHLPLRVSMALLKKMDLLITNDTGPLHLALAFQVPLVAIFGPTPGHLCWPHFDNPRVRILSKTLPCIQCVGRKCKLPYCLEQITVDEVFWHTSQLLNLKEAPSIALTAITAQ